MTWPDDYLLYILWTTWEEIYFTAVQYNLISWRNPRYYEATTIDNS